MSRLIEENNDIFKKNFPPDKELLKKSFLSKI
jgi:hypothetical protein